MSSPRLPQPGGDDGDWGDILNTFLGVEHNPDGTLKKAGDITTALSTAQGAQSTAASAVQNVNGQTGNTIALNLGNLNDVNTTGVVNGQALVKNGSNWTPGNVLNSNNTASTAGQVAVATSPGSNALTWQAKQIFDPRDYGAKFDGTTDDRGAMQACVDAAAAFITGSGIGAAVEMPAGTAFFNSGAPSSYRPSSWSTSTVLGVAIPVNLAAALTIKGQGKNATTIKLSANTEIAFFPHKLADYDVVQNINFEDFSVDNNNNAGTAAAIFGNLVSPQSKLLRLSYQDLNFRRLSTYNYTFDSTGTNLKAAIYCSGKHLSDNESTQTFTKNILAEDIYIKDCQAGILFQSPVTNIINHFYDNVVFRRCRHIQSTLAQTILSETSFYICGSGFGNYCKLEDCYSQGVGDDAVEIGAMQNVDIIGLRTQDTFTTSITFRLTHALSAASEQVIKMRDCYFKVTSARNAAGQAEAGIDPTQVGAARPVNFIIDPSGGSFGTFVLHNVWYAVESCSDSGINNGSGGLANLGFNWSTSARKVIMNNCGVVYKDYVYDTTTSNTEFMLRSALANDGTFTPVFISTDFTAIIDGWTDNGSGAGRPTLFMFDPEGTGSNAFDGGTFLIGRVVTTGSGLSPYFACLAEGGSPSVVRLRRMSGSYDSTTSTQAANPGRGGVRQQSNGSYELAIIEENDFRSPWRQSTTILDVTISQASLLSGTVERSNQSSFDHGYVRKSAAYAMTYLTRSVGITSTSSPLTVTLPPINTLRAPSPGEPALIYTVIDESGGAATNNITVLCAGSDTLLGGSTSATISTNYGSFSVYSNGTSWATVASGTNGGGSLMLDTAIAKVSASSTGAAGSTGKASDSGHYHPRYEWTATDHSLLAWAFDPALVSGSSSALATAGVLYLIKLHVPVAANVTNILVGLSVLGSGLTSGQNFAALYQGGNLIGVSADQTSAWNTGGTTGTKTIALSGGPFAVPAGDVYVGLWFNGTTGPSFSRSTATNAVNAGLAATSARFGQANTGVTTTAPGTLGTISTITSGFWAALS